MIGLILAMAVATLPSVDPSPPTGVRNPDVTQATIAETICKPGWTKTIRPKPSYTNRLKRQQLPPGSILHLWEEDHVLPLEEGGSPTDPDNLRPQLWEGPDGARAKDDQVETPTRRRICSGEITLEEGQAIIAAWITAHHPYPVVTP